MRRLMLLGLPIAGAGLALFVACARMEAPAMTDPEWITCNAAAAEDNETWTAVPDQGKVLTLDTGHKLEIAANAAPAGTMFRFIQVKDRPTLVMVTTRSNVKLQTPAVLTLVHANQGCLGIVDETKLAIYRVGRDMKPTDKLPDSPTVPPEGRVGGEVSEFSLFAIAQ